MLSSVCILLRLRHGLIPNGCSLKKVRRMRMAYSSALWPGYESEILAFIIVDDGFESVAAGRPERGPGPCHPRELRLL